MHTMLRLVLLTFSVLSPLFSTSSAQTCNSHTFSENKKFATCRDLPRLSSFLHWTYDQSTGKLHIAFRHGRISSTNRWVGWGINPKNNLDSAMPGAQVLVAIPQSGGSPRAYTAPIANYQTQLQQGILSFGVSGLSATQQNNEITIFATLTLPNGTTSVVHLWQDGPLSGSNPQQHDQTTEHFNSKETLNLASGLTQAAPTRDSLRTKRNVHGVLNAVSWGILMPTGAIIARYLKVFKSADAAWFYLHITCQASAYIVGVAGFGIGLKLGSDSVGITYDTHRALGIILFCLGTLQVFALLLRPNTNHKFRFCWNIYHHVVGYATIIISVVNIFEGFDALENSVGNRYKNWKNAYIGIIAALGGIAVFLEAFTWIIVLKRRKSENKTPHHTNGANGFNNIGYGSSL